MALYTRGGRRLFRQKIKLVRDASCVPLLILEDDNKMTKWIANLFQSKNKYTDIVRFIRTEYYNDTKHLTDEDVISYYDYITHKRRKA